ncbi:MAG: hypothetical protein ACK5Q5_23380 [Planctomycetaceae bacterium]
MTIRPANHPPLHALLLGSVADAEFGAVRGWLDRQVEQGELVLAEQTQGDWLRGDVETIPDMVIVCQTWSDEWTACQVEPLLGAWPLARVVCCQGRWCVSDGRTRQVWPWACRVPVESAVVRLQQELAMLQGRLAVVPFTASREEAFASDDFACGLAEKSTMPAADVTVITLDRDYGETLCELLASWGLTSHWSPQPRAAIGPSADHEQRAGERELVLFDIDPLLEHNERERRLLREVEALRHLFPHACLMAMSTDCSARLQALMLERGVNAVGFRLTPVQMLRETISGLLLSSLNEPVDA